MKQSTVSAFFQVKNPQPKKYTSNTIVPEIVIYTDGACINNGKPNAKAGWGIYISEYSDKNAYGIVEGKQSNNTGELTAIIKAYEAFEDEINNTPMPEDLNFNVKILCNDCLKESETKFHIIGHKCQECGSFNTRRSD